MRYFFPILLTFFGLTNATSLQAAPCGPYIVVRFTESAPDIFTIINKSVADWKIESLVIDLKRSAGRLFFDTRLGGAGASMPSNFEPVKGEVELTGITDLRDGDQHLTLRFDRFDPSKAFEFYIDLDDRLKSSDFEQANITGPELSGTEISVQINSGLSRPTIIKGIFDETGEAKIGDNACV